MSAVYKITALVIFTISFTQTDVKAIGEKEEHILNDSCKITHMEELSFRCLGDEHYITFDLVTENEGMEFRVFRNQQFNKTFRYDNLPVEAGPFAASSGMQGTLTFQDNIYLYCIYSQTYTAPNCTGCEIQNVSYSIQNCQEGEFYIRLNFDHTNTNTFYTFSIDNAIVDTFSYETLPLIFGPFSDANPVYDIEVRDILQRNCFFSFDINSPVCTPIACELSNISITQTACLDEEYNLVVDFDFKGQSGHFEFWLDGLLTGEYSYNSLPLVYGPLSTPNDLIHIIQVVDVADQSCFTGGMIEVEDCTGICELRDLELEQLACVGGEYYIRIDISRQFASDEADIYVDGNLVETRNFDDFPLTIGPFLSVGEKSRLVRIADSIDGLCFLEEILTVTDCRPECALSNPEIEFLPCDETEFNILLNFSYADVNEEFFIIDLAGNTFGTFLYEDLPIEVGPFEGDTLIRYYLAVFDENEDCDLILIFDGVDCLSTSVEENSVAREIKIFPNPASQHFSIPELSEGKVTLIDLNGKVVRIWNNPSTMYSIEDIATGFYMVRWQNNREIKLARLNIAR